MTNFTESELIPVALKIILNKLNGIETKDLIIELRNLMSPSCEDLEMLSNRNDDKFSQKVRNIKSHKTLENKGYVKFYDNKFFITEEGVKYLDQISWRDLDKIYSNIEVNHKQNENSDLSKPASNILKENEITLNNKEYLFEALSKKLKPQPEINKMLLKKLDGFFLTSRTLNCLKNENIVYVGDLIQLTENYLLKSNNFGRKSLEDLKNILSSMSLYLGMELSNWNSLREKLIHKDKLSEINFSHEDIDGKKKVFNGKKSIFENFETSRKFNLQKKIFIDVNLKIIDVEKLIIQDIEIILSQLNIKYKNLFKYRYAYLEEFKTLEEAGIIYGVTRERIRQLERDINKSLSYIGLIDKNSLIEYFENMKNLSFHKFFPSLSKNFRKLPRSKGTHDIGKNGLANFMENFCGVKEGFFKTTERVLSDFDVFKLQDIFLITPSGNDSESFLEIIQDYYGYDKFSANSAIELMVEKKLIKIVDNKIYAIKMNKNLEVAHILLNYPDGLHWKKISKLGNNSYTENKWSTNKITADPSISMNVNNFIYLSNIGTHKLLKFCKELKKKEKIISIFKNTLKELDIEQDSLEKIYGKIIEFDEFKDLNYYDARAIIKLFGEDKGLFYLGKNRAQVIGLVKKLAPNRIKERIKEIIINEQQEITVEEINNKLHRANENTTLEQNYNSLANSLDDLVEEMVIFRINPRTYLNFNDAINLCDIIEVKESIERLLSNYEFVVSSFIREKINAELGYTLSGYYYESLCRKLAKDNFWYYSSNYLSNKKPKTIGTHKYIKNLFNNNLSNSENYLIISKKIGISRMYFNNITYTKNIELNTDWVHQND